ncbi:hypothetical protein C8J56DRAFT_1076592 [Mycena floridula]|nr:hypothetical protein C8J56DRAFT_1076592 [Mycena floridula]
MTAHFGESTVLSRKLGNPSPNIVPRPHSVILVLLSALAGKSLLLDVHRQAISSNSSSSKTVMGKLGILVKESSLTVSPRISSQASVNSCALIVDWQEACFSGRYRRKLNHLLPIPTIFTTNWLAVIHKTISISPRYSTLTDPWTTDVRTAGIEKRLEKKCSRSPSTVTAPRPFLYHRQALSFKPASSSNAHDALKIPMLSNPEVSEILLEQFSPSSSTDLDVELISWKARPDF